MDISAFDMASEFGDKGEFFFDMFHYTPDGSRRFAKLLKPVVSAVTKKYNHRIEHDFGKAFDGDGFPESVHP